MRDILAYKELLILVFSKINSALDIRGSTISALDLSGSTVEGDFRLGDRKKSAVWKTPDGAPGVLILRNTRIGNLMDVKDAWPARGSPSYEWLGVWTFGRLRRRYGA